MRVKSLKKNMTELTVGRVTILFSYETPVACCIDGEGFYRTKKFFSTTTSRHINQWLLDLHVSDAKERPQEFFETLLTISRHINQWLRDLHVSDAKERPQEFFETLLNKRDQS